MGEPAGIGGEIILKAWLRRREGLPPFVVIDDADRLGQLAVRLELDVAVERCASLEAEKPEAFWRRDTLPVLHRPLARPVVPGRPDPANAAAVVQAVELAVQMVKAGAAAALVTAPVHKKVLYDGGFRFPGHTEFLAALAGEGARPVMMLAGEGLRVAPVTIHVSLRRAIDSLRAEDIVRTACIAEAALRRDFGLAAPRLAVAGLNPHAGEEGEMGREELDIIAPAVRVLKERGIAASGPVPPDTLFSPRARQGYDAAICMYHDQALIPLKALDFDGGVNVTLGLPFVRTSPDHGTAFDIAGTGCASENSMMSALKLAASIAARRAAVTDP
jgi:4-hydroxythreonine-4-phosphate dehydrogenase